MPLRTRRCWLGRMDERPVVDRMDVAECDIQASIVRMRTLYLRNVPDEVVERLERLASRAGTSVSAYATRELAVIAGRADNPELLAALNDIVKDVVDNGLYFQWMEEAVELSNSLSQ